MIALRIVLAVVASVLLIATAEKVFDFEVSFESFVLGIMVAALWDGLVWR